MQLSNRHTVITGGTSGIGREIVMRLGGVNRVAVIARNADRLAALAANLDAVETIIADLSVAADVSAAAEREEAKSTFVRHGFVMILRSRAVPILPELTACLAGMTGMSFPRFLLAWTLSTLPYTLVAAFAGSISSVDSPQPAILAAIGISLVLWTAWFRFRRRP